MAETALVMQPDTPGNILRQAGMLVGIAASVALGVYVVMWARTPNYTILYSDLPDRDVTQIAEALKATDIQHRIDPASGAILVAASSVHDARLKLAADGLPKSSSMGFELMQEEQGFGTSQFLERARHQRAMEGELSRSISRINNVRGARVHLGLPRQSVFSRSQREPTASVILDLYAGRKLEAHQVSAITHLVSASVPNLPAQKVTVVDQQGNLLTDQGGNEDLVLTGRRFEHRQRLEHAYMERIEEILMPYVGPDGVRAQVTADLDFTMTEQTREYFNPDLPAVRSEQTLEESRIGAGIGGVPGALSNEPPAASSAPEETGDAADGDDGDTGSGRAGGNPGDVAVAPPKPESTRSSKIVNFELDKTISHTKPSLGSIRRLSVAVVLRKPPGAGKSAGESEEPAAVPEPGSPEEAAAAAAAAIEDGFNEQQLAEMTELVKGAIGFDPTRGDTVSVTSVEFFAPETPEALPEPAIWEQPWVWDVGKQVLGALFVVFLVFGVLRPAMKSLVRGPGQLGGNLAIGADGTLAALPGGGAVGGGELSADNAGAEALPSPESGGPTHQMIKGPELPRDVEGVRDYVNKEPKIAAQVVRGWVGDEK